MSGRAIHAGLTLFIAAALFTAACARRAVTQIPAPAKIGASETGIASWYGAPYSGRRAASGEIFDTEEFTAAHKTLPFGTWVQVNDLDNGKQVEVRINDRGPFVDGRILDLSLAAARQIEMVAAGTARVRLKVIGVPASASVPAAERYAVQAGAFSNRENAESVRSSLGKTFEDTRVVQASPLWRVLVGHQLTRDAADKLAGKVRQSVGDAVVVRDR